MLVSMLLGAIEQGLIYAILALGVYITYKILDFPDLSVDGTFPFGAVITAVCITNGMNPLLAMLISVAGGATAGLITGIVHVKCKVRDLLSGIITMTALWSVNLIVGNNVANITITPTDNVTLFLNNSIADSLTNAIQSLTSGMNSSAAALLPRTCSQLVITIVIVAAAKLLLDYYLKTKSGFLLRAVGDNPSVVTTLAKNSGTVKIIGLVISNALVALAGSVMVQQTRAYNITMGTGAIVIGLASVIIGTNLFKRAAFIKPTFAVIIGSVLYQICVSIAIAYVPESERYMKLITAVLFLAILIIGNKTGFARKKAKPKATEAALK